MIPEIHREYPPEDGLLLRDYLAAAGAELLIYRERVDIDIERMMGITPIDRDRRKAELRLPEVDRGAIDEDAEGRLWFRGVEVTTRAAKINGKWWVVSIDDATIERFRQAGFRVDPRADNVGDCCICGSKCFHWFNCWPLCGEQCVTEWKRRDLNRRKRISKKRIRRRKRAVELAGMACEFCKVPMIAERTSRKFCSTKCRVAAHRAKQRADAPEE